jgi:PPOX class probable F420-dependent enzyme
MTHWEKREEKFMVEPIPENALDLFEKPALAHLATVMPDGTPHVTPVWVDYDGTHILINTVRGRRKERNMRQRPQAGLTIVDPTNPWYWLSIRGYVVAVTEAGADEHLKKLAKKYLGSDDTSTFRRPGQVYVIYTIAPDRVIATPPYQW